MDYQYNTPQTPIPYHPPSRRKRTPILPLLFLCSLFGLGAGFGGAALHSYLNPNESAAPSVVYTTPSTGVTTVAAHQTTT
ncbi:MAG: hypothetical protein R3Y07_07450, partial [Eubacteriales bacterium]